MHRRARIRSGTSARCWSWCKKPGADVTREELLAFYEGKIAKWWTPDDVVFVDAIPLGATGKMLKNRLREQFKRLPAADRLSPIPPCLGCRPCDGALGSGADA